MSAVSVTTVQEKYIVFALYSVGAVQRHQSTNSSFCYILISPSQQVPNNGSTATNPNCPTVDNPMSSSSSDDESDHHNDNDKKNEEEKMMDYLLESSKPETSNIINSDDSNNSGDDGSEAKIHDAGAEFETKENIIDNLCRVDFVPAFMGAPKDW